MLFLPRRYINSHGNSHGNSQGNSHGNSQWSQRGGFRDLRGAPVKHRSLLHSTPLNLCANSTSVHTTVAALLSKCCQLSIPNIRNIFLILSCIPCCPQNSLNSSGGMDSTRSQKVFHRDAGPCWLKCFPQMCQVGWMSFGWWTILDTHGKLLSVKNPAALQFLTQTRKPGTYYHTLFKGT